MTVNPSKPHVLNLFQFADKEVLEIVQKKVDLQNGVPHLGTIVPPDSPQLIWTWPDKGDGIWGAMVHVVEELGVKMRVSSNLVCSTNWARFKDLQSFAVSDILNQNFSLHCLNIYLSEICSRTTAGFLSNLIKTPIQLPLTAFDNKCTPLKFPIVHLWASPPFTS